MRRVVSLIAILLFTQHISAVEYWGIERDSLLFDLSVTGYKVGVATLIENNNAYAGDVIIPNYVVHKGVTFYVKKIDERAFLNCTKLKSVVFPDSLTTIGTSAFYGCSGLTSLTLPPKLTNVGYNAFKGCTGLVSVDLPMSLPKIEVSMFENCTSLKKIILPDSVRLIRDRAFYGCSELTEIVMDSVKTLGGYVFTGCGLEYSAP